VFVPRTVRRAVLRWFYRISGPETSPIVLTQRRVFVLPTAGGAAFGMMVLVLLAGSINYVLSLGYLLTFLLAGLGIAGIVHTFRNLVRLEFAAGRCEPVFAGGLASFHLLITNRRGDERPALRLSARGAEPVDLSVPGQASVAVALSAQAPRRGWLRLRRVTVDTIFPLGLVRAWSYIQPDMRCLIWPKPEIDPPGLPSVGQGAADGLDHGSGVEDFAGLRGYQLADSPRHVAWKAVARDAPLMTKQFTGGRAGAVWLDWHALPPSLDGEARIARLTAWALAAHGSGRAFGLRLPGVEMPPATGTQHLERCLRALALHDIAR
jgi:uncharacterized protein (DUF58 family)